MPRGRSWLVNGVVLIAILIVMSPLRAAAAPGKCDVPLVDPVCEVSKTVAGGAGDVITAPIRYAAGSAVEMVTSWVADTAQWILGKIIRFIETSTSPTLDAGWFTERYRFMAGLAALLLVPMLLIATIRAAITQDVAQLLRSYFVYVPVAILGTFIAVYLTQALLAVTDALSAAVAQNIAGDVSQIFDSIGKTLSESIGAVTAGAPSFAVFFAALLLIVGSFFVWLELLIRSAAVTAAVFFLPLILAGLVWPATVHWTKRLIEILVALILSKFVIVAVISLATAALSDPGGGGFGTVMGGAALMLMAAFSPFALLKLIPMVEGAAIEHLPGVSRRPLETPRAGGSVNQAMSVMRAKVRNERAPALAVAGPGSPVGASGGKASAAVAGVAVARTAEAAVREPGRRVARHVDSTRANEAPAHGAESDPPKRRIGGRISPPSRLPKKPGTNDKE